MLGVSAGGQVETTMMTQPKETTMAIATQSPELAMIRSSAPQLLSGVVMPTSSLLMGLEGFLRYLDGRNCSPSTLRAYATDLSQFVGWLFASFSPDILAEEIQRSDLEDYLFTLARAGLTGLTRARKLAA